MSATGLSSGQLELFSLSAIERGCSVDPLEFLAPRLRELNARMVEAGLVSASAPQARRLEFERGDP